MIIDERRPTRRYKRRENKKFPYRKHRNRSCMFERVYETIGRITGNPSRKSMNKIGEVAPFGTW